MTEFELKFEIPPAQLKSVAVAVLQGKAKRQRLQASYFDTPDGALARHGIIVRLRKDGRRWVQTAKGPTADLLERLEHNVALSSRSAGAAPPLDLARHRGTPVGRAIDKALGLKAIDKALGIKDSEQKDSDNYPDLALLYSTDVQRMTCVLTVGGSLVEVALDQGRVFANSHSQPICELEVELKDGTPLDAVALAQQWRGDHGLWMSTIAKSMKGQRLGQAVPYGAATSAVAPTFARQASGQKIVAAVVAACLGQILPNMSELAAGSYQSDHVHQLRVGIRRLRTALRELGDLAGAAEVAFPQWEAALVGAFRALGEHRDRSNLALVLQPQLLAAGGPAMRLGAAESNLADVGQTVRAADFQEALLGLLGFVHSEVTESANKPDALKKAVSIRLDKLYKRALKDGKKFLTLGQEQQHGVRKRLKRLRYLIEFAEPLFTARKVDRMAKALKPVQDALGLYNDELMALHTCQALAASDPQAWFGVGWLAARKQANAKRCLKEIKTFAAIKPFWRD